MGAGGRPEGGAAATAATANVGSDWPPLLTELEPFLLTMAERLCGNRADARDLVQDTFERALRQVEQAAPRNLRAWLAATLHNLFIDHCRARARRPVVDPLVDDLPAAAEDPAPAPPWAHITIDDVRAAVGELDPIFRDVYILHTFEHQTYEQIAARLGIERITVGTRLSRARRRLREILSQRLAAESPP